MKKIIRIILVVVISLLTVIATSVTIYLWAESDTIELTAIPTSDVQEQLDVFVEAGLCWKAYVNEDETAAVIHLSKKQREKWKVWITDSMNRSLEDVNKQEDLKFYVSEDRKKLTLSANENMSYKTVAAYVSIFIFDMEIYQVLSGEENWSIDFVLEDMETKEVLYTADFPEETIKVNDKIWNGK